MIGPIEPWKMLPLFAGRIWLPSKRTKTQSSLSFHFDWSDSANRRSARRKVHALIFGSSSGTKTFSIPFSITREVASSLAALWLGNRHMSATKDILAYLNVTKPEIRCSSWGIRVEYKLDINLHPLKAEIDLQLVWFAFPMPPKLYFHELANKSVQVLAATLPNFCHGVDR